jgi:4-oxalocrotonate tautomerase
MIGMPAIIVNVSNVDMEKKRKLAAELTKTASEVLGMPEAAFQLYINEHGKENIAVGGTLLVDK